MLNQKDILQTLDMIDKRHLDIRTITMGISLMDCCDPDLAVCCDKIYKKITTYAKDLVKVGEVIELKESSRSLDKFKGSLEANASRVVPKWLEMTNNVAKVVAEPAREDIDLPIEEHLIVELYSK